MLGLTAELGMILFIIYTAIGYSLFGTAAIGAEAWLLALAGAALMWIAGGRSKGMAAAGRGECQFLNSF
jgi:hypothetical protein